jgi:glucosamine kinase
MLLVADAGNSKTTWSLTDTEKILECVTGEGISPYFDDESQIAAKIRNALSGFPLDQITSVWYYGTGCLHEVMQMKISSVISRLICHAGVMVSDDLTAAALALFGRDEGLAVISGTGSNAGICQGGDIVKRIVSLGYLLGDEGSGADIGFRFLKIHLSGRLPETAADMFRNEINLSDQELLQRLYSQKKPQAFAASLVPFLQKNLTIPEIRECVNSSFVAMIEQMIVPLISDQSHLPLGFCGSVAKMFEPELRSVADQYALEIKSVIKDPAIPLTHFLMAGL